MTALYAVLHFLTDGLCAFAMFGRFMAEDQWYLYLLIYNFCAFALQLPLGTLMDVLRSRYPSKGRVMASSCAIAGLLVTFLGAFTHPAVLGTGNALFHVGGGIGTMDEDREKKKKGALLGVFVSPGAIGLYLGTVAGKAIHSRYYLLACLGFLLLFVCGSALLILRAQKNRAAEMLPGEMVQHKTDIWTVTAAVFLFSVVVIRSYTGLTGSFSWKQGFFMGLMAVLALALGKTAGGIVAARFGMMKTMVVSLLLAAGCYLLSDRALFGLLALFLFNMTMPVTLYMLAERFPYLPGFSFGLLTLALFMGFFPVWLEKTWPVSTSKMGAVMSLVSLGLLVLGLLFLKKSMGRAERECI